MVCLDFQDFPTLSPDIFKNTHTDLLRKYPKTQGGKKTCGHSTVVVYNKLSFLKQVKLKIFICIQTIVRPLYKCD